MREYPEGVRSVILDAVYPPEADKYIELAADGERALNQIFKLCAADSKCKPGLSGIGPGLLQPGRPTG